MFNARQNWTFILQHEAGHFLIAYLLGILPRGYTISSFEALQKEGSLNVQAGTSFVDFEFLEEVCPFPLCQEVSVPSLMVIEFYRANKVHCLKAVSLFLAGQFRKSVSHGTFRSKNAKMLYI